MSKERSSSEVDSDPSARCVIVGGGFAGAKIATYFDSIFDVTLIDEKNFLEASQTELVPVLCKPWDDRVSPLMARSLQFLHRFYLKNADILLGTACHVSSKYVTLADGRKQPYDLLVLATGEQRCFPFSTQQRTISGRISELRAFNKFLHEDCKKIAIIGGGPMGVALASSLVENQPDKEVVLFHRQNELTPGLPRHVRSHALRSLAAAHNNGLAAMQLEGGRGETVKAILSQQQAAAKIPGAHCPSLQLRLNSTVVDVRPQGPFTAPTPECALDNEERRLGAGLADPPAGTSSSAHSLGSVPWWSRVAGWWRKGSSPSENHRVQMEGYLATFAEQLLDRKEVVLAQDLKIIQRAVAAIPHTLQSAQKFTVVADECWKSDNVFSEGEVMASYQVGNEARGSWLYAIASYIPPLAWALPYEQLSASPKPVVVGTGRKNKFLLSEGDALRKAQNERSVLHRVYFGNAVPTSSSYHADTFLPNFRKERQQMLEADSDALNLDTKTGSSLVVRKEFKDFDYVFNLTGGVPRPIVTPNPKSPLLKQIPAFLQNPDFTDGTNPSILDDHIITSDASAFSFRHISGLAGDAAVSLVRRMQDDASSRSLYSPYAGSFDSVIGFAGGGLGENSNGKGEGASCKLVGKYRVSSLFQLYQQPNIFALGSCNALPWVNSVGNADIQTKHLFKNMNKIISAPAESPRLWIGAIDGINTQLMRTPRITVPLGRGVFPEAPSGIIKLDRGKEDMADAAAPSNGNNEPNEIVVGNNGTSVYTNLNTTRYFNGLGSSDIVGSVTGASAIEEHNNAYASFYSEFIRPIFFKKTTRALTRATVDNWLQTDFTDVTDFTFV